MVRQVLAVLVGGRVMHFLLRVAHRAHIRLVRRVAHRISADRPVLFRPVRGRQVLLLTWEAVRLERLQVRGVPQRIRKDGRVLVVFTRSQYASTVSFNPAEW